MEFYSFNNPNLNLAGDTELSREFAEEILWTLATDELLIADDSFDILVQSFETPTTIDAYQTVGALAQTTPAIGKLLGGKTGVRESYRLHEHTQAVLNGFEADYAAVFPDPQDKKLLRTTLLLQDIGKSLCVAHCGNRREQSPYNAAMVENMLVSVPETTLDTDDKQTIRLLLAHDILGGALKGYKGIEESVAAQQVAELEPLFPGKYRDRYKLLMRIVYMSDVSAYTNYRSYVAAEDGQITPCLPGLNEEYKVLTMHSSGKVVFKDPANNALLDRLTEPL